MSHPTSKELHTKVSQEFIPKTILDCFKCFYYIVIVELTTADECERRIDSMQELVLLYWDIRRGVTHIIITVARFFTKSPIQFSPEYSKDKK
jgi:hypothetical protein